MLKDRKITGKVESTKENNYKLNGTALTILIGSEQKSVSKGTLNQKGNTEYIGIACKNL